MYTSYIGGKFLHLYNQRKGTSLDAKDFFDQVLFSLFFDDKRHLMHVHGSSFFQKISSKNFPDEQNENKAKLYRLHKDIQNGKISGSTFVGYAAENLSAVSSGQVSSIKTVIDKNEIYLSWIGAALAISVGGSTLLLDRDDLLWGIYNGWKYYREFISEIPNIKGNQIETWNGHWVNHFLSADFDSNYPLDDFKIYPEKSQSGGSKIPSIPWVNLIFSLSKKFRNEIITSNVFFFEKTNSTFGFINIYLPDIFELYEIRDKIFIDQKSSNLKDHEIEKLVPFFNFRSACMRGTIGLKSLEPRGLRRYMPKGTILYAQGKDFKFSEENSIQSFNLFKLWIIAMLNKTELLDLAAKLAHTILIEEQSNQSGGRGKTTASRSSQELLESNNIRLFIEKLTNLLQKENAQLFKELVNQVIKMPSDNFPLFITLVRFEYQYQKHNS